MIAAAIEATVEAATESTQTWPCRNFLLLKIYHDLRFASTSKIGNMVTPSTSAASAWRAKVTPVVAAHLLHFGVERETFDILQCGGLHAADIEDRFTDGLRTTSRAGSLRKGDILVLQSTMAPEDGSRRTSQVKQTGQDQLLVKVEEVKGHIYTGKTLTPAREVWGRAAPMADLYETCE